MLSKAVDMQQLDYYENYHPGILRLALAKSVCGLFSVCCLQISCFSGPFIQRLKLVTRKTNSSTLKQEIELSSILSDSFCIIT